MASAVPTMEIARARLLHILVTPAHMVYIHEEYAYFTNNNKEII
jgi:hypothetical protein